MNIEVQNPMGESMLKIKAKVKRIDIHKNIKSSNERTLMHKNLDSSSERNDMS